MFAEGEGKDEYCVTAVSLILPPMNIDDRQARR